MSRCYRVGDGQKVLLIDIEKEANEEKDTLDVDLRQKKYRK
jgi:hypothetical protein